MKSKDITLLVAILLIGFKGYGQWNELPAYPPGSSCGSGNITYSVGNPDIISNGVIIYLAGCDGPTWCHSAIMKSTNDLRTANLLTQYYISLGFGGYYSVYSANDSTHVTLLYNNSSFAPLELTFNDFSTDTTLTDYYYSGALFTFTKNYLYGTSDNYKSAGAQSVSNCYNLKTYKRIVTDTLNYPNLKELQFVNDSTSFMVSDSENFASGHITKSILLKTINYGMSWTSSYRDSMSVISSFAFPSSLVGYFCTSAGSVYKTVDGGNTWDSLKIPAMPQLNCISFANDSVGYVGGVAGNLFKTSNGGLTWSKEISNDTLSIIKLAIFDTTVYYVDASSNIYKNQYLLSVNNLNGSIASVTVYPNPNNGAFKVDISTETLLSGKKLEMTVYNVFGQQIFTTVLKSSSEMINIGQQPNGLYLCRFFDENGHLLSVNKFIIE